MFGIIFCMHVVRTQMYQGMNAAINKRNKPKKRLTKSDVAVMKGIAQSGALQILREVGGLYSPGRGLKPCTNMPSHPVGYVQNSHFDCGLTDLVLGDERNVAIWWPESLILKAFHNELIMWHTHPDQTNPGIIHSPPSIDDFQVSLAASRKMSINVDQLMVSSRGLWRLHTKFSDVSRYSEKDLQDSILNFNFYAAFIQSKEEVAKTNAYVDTPHERMTVPFFVDFMNRNIKGFTVEFYPF